MSQVKTLALVTGGSRGFGVAICEQLAKKVENIDFSLYARSQQGLESTEKLIKQIKPSANVNLFVADFGDIASLQSVWSQSLKKVNFSEYQRVWLFNNHGSLGPITNVSEYVFNSFLIFIDMDQDHLSNFKEIESEITLNVTSVFVTSSLFLKEIKSVSTPIETSVINTSSLAAIQPFDTWGIYCVGKAAREMLLSVITAECKDTPNIKTLNWSPGAMGTDMNKEILVKTKDEGSKQFWEDMIKNNKLVDPNFSAGKMIDLLISNTYTSAAHIDVADA
ncbi:sepiapterin reductase [Heterostelium album PN500]|uniref:Sepiapterin reductase n=1 Tax=Heterostelium pallidum (strain ATCC 26659 / Pp 5 / PN500) TaxID=670386 RepID=D3AVZ3_HETP5|nr:sepiapterin reductase [Heterostelium album PN500]EFA86466.1 sepiapterin reductase [Heterostelium album PN500]|eukprot:XP_020438571.1 sepiapterin reductase [Heterostelium album PN500]